MVLYVPLRSLQPSCSSCLHFVGFHQVEGSWASDWSVTLLNKTFFNVSVTASKCNDLKWWPFFSLLFLQVYIHSLNASVSQTLQSTSVHAAAWKSTRRTSWDTSLGWDTGRAIWWADVELMLVPWASFHRLFQDFIRFLTPYFKSPLCSFTVGAFTFHLALL